MQEKRKNPYYQAQAILSFRDHSIKEMRTKLRRKGFSSNEIDTTIEQLSTKGLLNDTTFADAFVESTLKRKGVGPRWLAAKLREKGIDEATIQETLAAHVSTEQEKHRARQTAQRWQETHRKVQNDQGRLARFLASRGFTHEAITEGIQAMRQSS